MRLCASLNLILGLSVCSDNMLCHKTKLFLQFVCCPALWKWHAYYPSVSEKLLTGVKYIESIKLPDPRLSLPPLPSAAVHEKWSLVWIGAGCCKASYRQANNEAMIPHSATWTGKDGEEELRKWRSERKGTGIGRCEEDERKTEGGFNGVCVEPQSPGSVWTQRNQK